ncbi:MAG: hypothetical protein E7374_00500 [Clostridiales bacterium]|nr:hypothetical protein [Clostridiales bacterium]
MNKKEILKYSNFRKCFNFNYENLVVKDDKIFFKGELVEDSEKKYAEGENFINVGYNFKNSKAKALSNLFPIKFKFRGKIVNSIEGVLQGIKYKNQTIQNQILEYSGLDAYHTRSANSLDFWSNSGLLYWQGKEIVRESEEYQLFLDELYLSVLKNPLYQQFLLATENKYILHHIGCENANETVLTRFEYEQRLNSLRAYLKNIKKDL